MPEVATLKPNHILELPVTIAERFQPSDRFAIWMDGDTLHLKWITPSSLRVVEEAPPGEPLSLDEINEMVHEVRRQRNQRKGK